MLDQIVTAKRQELVLAKERVPLSLLLEQVEGEPSADFAAALRRPGINIIAEIKFRSPSHGPFRFQGEPEEMAQRYEEHGAAAVSVLTEKEFFGGELDFLTRVSEKVQLPLLRKDFILDRYQIPESRIRGASAYLLIVNCLSRDELEELIRYGEEFELQALVEVHDPYELETAVENQAPIIGVNNRNLHTFEVNLSTSFDLARRLEGELGHALVSESGLTEHSQLRELQDAGFHGFLIGSAFMDAADPGQKLQELLNT